MPLRVTCPKGHSLSLNERLAGKRIKCPRCQTSFVVEEDEDEDKDEEEEAPRKSSPSAKRRPRDEEDEEEERPRRKKARDDDDEEDDDDDIVAHKSPEERRKDRIKDKRQRLRQVNVGILLHLIKLWTTLLMAFFGLLLHVFATVVAGGAAGAGGDLGRESITLFALFAFISAMAVLVGVVIAPILGVVGSGFCIMIPKKSEARGTIIASFLFDIVGFIGTIVLAIASLGGIDMEPQKLSRLVSMVQNANLFFTLAAWFLFMVFLRQMAHYLQRPSLGNDALNLIAYLIVELIALIVVLIACGFLFGLMMPFLGAIMGLMMLFIVVIIWFGQFYYIFFYGMIRLLNAMRAIVKENS